MEKEIVLEETKNEEELAKIEELRKYIKKSNRKILIVYVLLMVAMVVILTGNSVRKDKVWTKMEQMSKSSNKNYNVRIIFKEDGKSESLFNKKLVYSDDEKDLYEVVEAVTVIAGKLPDGLNDDPDTKDGIDIYLCLENPEENGEWSKEIGSFKNMKRMYMLFPIDREEDVKEVIAKTFVEMIEEKIVEAASWEEESTYSTWCDTYGKDELERFMEEWILLPEGEEFDDSISDAKVKEEMFEKILEESF